VPATAEASRKSAWWRAVLGEYPTGVCLVAARDATGRPVGLVVGSFVAISEEPPLIGFFVDRASTSFPGIAAAGRFAVSVLRDDQEDFCRAVFRRDPGRWDAVELVDTASGSPRLVEALAWFDATIDRVESIGDHDLVIGAVTDFGVGRQAADGPLLFRRAGYGSFAAPAEGWSSQAFLERLRWASAARGELAALAEDLGLVLLVTTQLGDAIVFLASAAPAADPRSHDLAGTSYPFAAPADPVFVAWSAARRHAWEEAARHLVGRVDREAIAHQLATVRRRGFAVVVARSVENRFFSALRPSEPRESYARMWAEVATHWTEPAGTDAAERVVGIQLPVFSRDGEVALALTVADLPADLDEDARAALAARVGASAERLSEIQPAD
jgi:flavin reductase (DIM6/NTAB) family NADH-FMN oxidoreductase RutF/DNA-binding IclR family transcriptional regulator